MGKRIVIVGAGAVGGYTGAHMAQAGEDVTYIDPWPEHVEEINRNGFRITHHQGPEPFNVKVRALHLTEAQHLSKEAPVDIAFICMKSYDTQWAAMLIRQYLSPAGYVVSLQNCMNEATIAEVVGWGKVLGCIASNISVGLIEPGHVHRGGIRGKDRGHTVYRIGEALGYKLEEINHLPPEVIARAGEGDPDAIARYDDRALTQPRGSAEQRPSMGQDMAKGRRTEIEFLNGFVVREGEKVGLAARANERLVDFVKKVERGELKQDLSHITELRLN